MIYKILLPILVIALLFVVWMGGGRDLVQKKISEEMAPTPTLKIEEDKTAVVSPVVTEVSQKSDQPEGWQTYTNTKYGFTISYPSNYKVLTSKDDLYGWEKAIALFYGGGQSYDVAVEVWNSETEYKEKYVDVPLTVFQVNGKFVTLYDETKQPDNKTLISSFEKIN